MLETGDVKCPTCNIKVVEYHCINIEVETNRVHLFKTGKCPCCGNYYQWHEEFTYEGYHTPEEIKKDDESANIW